MVIDAKASIRSSSSTRSRWRPTLCSSTWPLGAPILWRQRRVCAASAASGCRRRPRREIFEVAGLQKKVRELLATEVNDLLTADAHARDFDTDTDDWVLRGSCETCNFRASCEKQAADRGRLCALPGLRADDAVELQGFSAGAAGRNAIERLQAAVRT